MSYDSLNTPRETGKSVLKFALGVVFVLLLAFILSSYIKSTGVYPRGSDIYGHLFRCNLIYEQIQESNYFPVYTEYWYNGFQPFRYSGPLSYYIVGGMQFIAGNTMDAYIMFVGVSFAIGAIGWLLFGLISNRMLLCTVLGCLWFVLPDNARVFFSEGNLPRMAISMILPYFFFFLWQFLVNKKNSSIIMVILLTGLITLSHVMIGAYLGIASFIFLAIFSACNKRWRESITIIIAMLLGLTIIGFWLYPALNGGIMRSESTAITEYMAQKASISANPFARLNLGFDTFYYGISVLIISLVGLLLSNRKCFAGFVIPILIFVGTTTAVLPIVIQIPFGELIWMMRFVPIIYAMFLVVLIEWKQCKKTVVFFFCILLIADSLLSYRFISTAEEVTKTTEQRQQQVIELYGFDTAKEITSQRIAYIDSDKTDSFPAYALCKNEPRTKYASGWNFQAAGTAANLVLLNTALEMGAFNYLFDRAIEMGNDTVIIRKDALPDIADNVVNLKESGLRSDYLLVDVAEESFIFHRETPANFGVVSRYEGLAIGLSAAQISLVYPYFGTAESYKLTDYTYEELKDYKKIYLSGFTYNDKEVAERLIKRLANHGVQIYIDMNRIPDDPRTKRMTLLDVTAQQIVFETQYPPLQYRNREIRADFFKEELSIWNTVFIENVPNIKGYSYLDQKKLNFYGTAANQNINFMAFNLLYHAIETKDQEVLVMLNEIFSLNENMLPERELVPFIINYETNGMIIKSPVDELNTTVAFQDIFYSNNEITANNNMLMVDKGTTEIKFVNPYYKKGMLITALGFLGAICLVIFIRRRSKHDLILESEHCNETQIKSEPITEDMESLIVTNLENMDYNEQDKAAEETIKQMNKGGFLDYLDKFLIIEGAPKGNEENDEE